MVILLTTPIGWNETLYYAEINKHIERGWAVVEQYTGSERLFTKLETNVQEEIYKYCIDTH